MNKPEQIPGIVPQNGPKKELDHVVISPKIRKFLDDPKAAITPLVEDFSKATESGRLFLLETSLFELGKDMKINAFQLNKHFRALIILDDSPNKQRLLLALKKLRESENNHTVNNTEYLLGKLSTSTKIALDGYPGVDTCTVDVFAQYLHDAFSRRNIPKTPSAKKRKNTEPEYKTPFEDESETRVSALFAALAERNDPDFTREVFDFLEVKYPDTAEELINKPGSQNADEIALQRYASSWEPIEDPSPPFAGLDYDNSGFLNHWIQEHPDDE